MEAIQNMPFTYITYVAGANLEIIFGGKCYRGGFGWGVGFGIPNKMVRLCYVVRHLRKDPLTKFRDDHKELDSLGEIIANPKMSSIVYVLCDQRLVQF